MSDHLRRTFTLLDTLLDYLPGPQLMRSAASDDAPASTSRTYTMAELDRQIAHLEAQERARRNDWNRPGSTPIEAARREQYRQGDYAAMDMALMDLEVHNAAWGSLAWRVAHHHPGVLDRALRIELVCTIRWLAGRLPEPLRVPEWTHRAFAPSPAQVAALRELGVPMSVLVRVYGRDAAALRLTGKRRLEIA